MQNLFKISSRIGGLIFILFLSCGKEKDAQVIIDQAITAAGSDLTNHKEIEFLFRNKEYGAKFDDGRYEYVRLFKDSSKLVRDVLNNDGFYREINGDKVEVPDTMATKYSNSVNSVIYFALLPKSLNDDAVIKNYLGTSKINGETYHEIQVTFQKEGGGEDHSDVFVYWVNAETDKIDYLGYSYETDGGGMRFRIAKNERYINGIRFVDYDNYAPTKEVEVKDLDLAYLNDNLDLVSEIILDNITVNEFQTDSPDLSNE